MTNVKSIKKHFKDKKLFDQALTHRSWVNENPKNRNTNERLEFLGDAILEYVVSRKIYKDFPTKPEGYLTNLRANLVNTKNLASVAKKLGIGEALFLSKGEDDGGGRLNDSLLADTLEAIIGALYIDQGIDIVAEFISENIFVDIKEKISQPLKDAKSRLQEIVQAKSLPAPKYKVVSEAGPDHNKCFTVEVLINNKKIATGKGKNKNEASRVAAENALIFYK